MVDLYFTDNLAFFLGGHDLEMLTIRELLEQHAPGRFHDKNLAWGAKASDYREEIQDVLANSRSPVLIELTLDMEIDEARTIIIDHHGERAGADKPASLHQVFELMKLPRDKWTRWFDLVAANDRGYIPAMLETGATQEEIIKVRESDRAAQGITAEEEAEGKKAAADAEVFAGGMLTLARLPHTRTATVTDRLEPALGGAGYRNLLVVSPAQVNFFGSGNLVYALNSAFPGGWHGGALPERGFWGHGEPVPDVLDLLLREAKYSRVKSMNKNQHIEYWLTSAAHDLEAAETLFQNQKYDWCLFIGHLVIEKALKAFYVRNTEEIPPKIHNLLKLAESTTLPFSDEQKQLMGEINCFNIEARYPDNKHEFYKLCTKEFTDEYFIRIKEIYQWLLLQMKQ
jgi:HEPN domain-containing protein